MISQPDFSINKMTETIQKEIDKLVEEAIDTGEQTVLINGVSVPIAEVKNQPIPVYCITYNDKDTFEFIAGKRRYFGRLDIDKKYNTNPALGKTKINESDLFVSSPEVIDTYESRLISIISAKPYIIADFETSRLARNEENPTLLNLVSCELDKSLQFFVSIDKTKLLAKNSDNYYYVNSDGSYVSMFTDSNDVSAGWSLDWIGDRYFFTNTLKPMGIRAVNNYKTVPSNQTSGYWKIAYSSDYYFALSTNGTDKGIKCCRKDFSSECNFIELPDVPKNNGDYYGWVYDETKKLTYFTSCRDELVEDMSKTDYDIDEFIYPLDEYTVKKIITDMNGTVTGSLANGLGTDFTKDKLKALVNSIKAQAAKLKEDQLGYEAGSQFFTNLVTSDMAKREFNMSNPKETSLVLLEMINNSAFGGDYMSKVIYQASHRMTYIKHHFDPDANGVLTLIPNENVLNHEAKWYQKHSTTSNDFLNSDEDGVIY